MERTWPHGPAPLEVRQARFSQAALWFVVAGQLPSFAVMGWLLGRWAGLAVGVALGLALTRFLWPITRRATETLHISATGIELRVPGSAPAHVAFDQLGAIGYGQSRGARWAVLLDGSGDSIDLSLDLRWAYHPPAIRWLPSLAAELLRHADLRGLVVHPRSRRILERYARRRGGCSGPPVVG